MKLTRGELKSIVKECLVEILSEGIGKTKSKPVMSQAPVSKTPPVSKQRQAQIPHISTGDNILDEVLLDTARTTLPMMQEAEGRKQPMPISGVEKMVNDNDPQKLFGDETTAKWAALAFNEVGKKS